MLRVLIIDPNAVNARLMEGILKAADFEAEMHTELQPSLIGSFDAIVADAGFFSDLHEYQQTLFVGDNAPEVTEVISENRLILRPFSPQDLTNRVSDIISELKIRSQTDTVSDISSGNQSADMIMQRVFDLTSDLIEHSDEEPCAAVIAKDGEIIAEATPKIREKQDPTATAVIEAIRAACEVLGTRSLAGCEIYTTCEPCALSLAAVYKAELDRMSFANTLEDMQDIGFDHFDLFDELSEPAERRRVPNVMLKHAEGKLLLDQWLNLKEQLGGDF